MSVYYTVLSSVKDVLSALPAFAGVSFAITERPFFSPDHGDTFTKICLCPEAEKVAGQSTENIALIDYPVVLAIIWGEKTALADQAELQAVLDRRETGRSALHKTSLPGASTVYDSSYEPAPAFDLAGLDAAYKVSLQRLTFRSREARSI